MSILIADDSDYVRITDNAKWTLTPVANDYSISFYWKTTYIPSAETEYQMFFQIDNQDPGYKFVSFIIYVSGLLFLICSIRNTDYDLVGYFYTLNPTISINTWHHMVFNSADAGNCEIYIDKVAQGITEVNWVSVGAIDPDWIFVSDGHSVYGDFNITHLTVTSNILTVATIHQYYKDPYACLDNPNLIAYFPMLEPAGTAHDLSPITTDGTLTDGASWDVGDDPLLGWANKEINDIDIVYPDKISGLRTGQIRKINGV